MLEIAYIFVVFLVDVLSEPMRLAIEPFSVVSNKLLFVVFIFVEDFDGSLAVSVSVSKTTQIVVLMWYILETKAVFLSLAREFIVPLANVEGAVEVPNNAFVGTQLKINSIFEFSDNDPFFAFFQIDAKDTIYMH